MNSIEKNINFGYSGKVNVKLMNGSTELFSTTYKNNGYKGLFRFFCECLCGNYQEADKFKPLRIKLFHNNALTPQAARENIMNNKDTSIVNGLTPLSGMVTLDAKPTIKEIKVKTKYNNGTLEGEYETYQTTFHFLIPYSYLINTTKDINQVMLYTSEFGSNYSKQNGLLAYYLCTKLDRGVEKWAPIEISKFTETDNLNLIIEWTMSIANIDN